MTFIVLSILVLAVARYVLLRPTHHHTVDAELAQTARKGDPDKATDRWLTA